MSPAAKCFSLLLLISLLLLLFNSKQLQRAISSKSNNKPVERDSENSFGSFCISLKSRVLLVFENDGLRAAKTCRKCDITSSAPGPAPAPAAVHTSGRATSLDLHKHHPPASHGGQTSTTQSNVQQQQPGRGEVRQYRIWLLISISGGTFFVMFVTIAAFFKCKRYILTSGKLRPLRQLQQNDDRPKDLQLPGVTVLHSFCPSPKIDYSRTGMQEVSIDNTAPLVEAVQHSIPENVEEEKLAGFDFDKQSVSTHGAPSDDEESFHSACFCGSLNCCIADFSFDCHHLSPTQACFSPSQSSYKSVSPNFQGRFCPVEYIFPLKSPLSTNFTFLNTHAASCSSSLPKTNAHSLRPSATEPQKAPTHQQTDHRVSSADAKQCRAPLPSQVKCGSSEHKLQNPVPLTRTGSKRTLLPPLPQSQKPASDTKDRNPRTAPPPPPLPLQTQLSQNGRPLPRLKPLHWDKVHTASNRPMVWDSIKPSSFELDEQMMESLFKYNIQNSTLHEAPKNKNQSPIKHIIEHKRLQNITILLKTLNATTQQVCNSINQGSGLSNQQLEGLVKMAPTKDEEEKLSCYDGDTDELDPAEVFLKVLLRIPMAFRRIKAMLYIDTFEDEVTHIRVAFEVIQEACKELRCSKLFLKLLEAVLRTGNRMNVGTIRGGAKAFKLDALLKLADVKGIDGKTTLLHFVMREIIKSSQSNTIKSASPKEHGMITTDIQDDCQVTGLQIVSTLITELSTVKKAATIDLEVLVHSISNLSSGMAELSELANCKFLNSTFMHCIQSFLDHAEKTMKSLRKSEQNTLIHIRELTDYFHGEGGKDEANLLHIFVIVKDFLVLLERVCKELSSKNIHPSFSSRSSSQINV